MSLSHLCNEIHFLRRGILEVVLIMLLASSSTSADLNNSHHQYRLTIINMVAIICDDATRISLVYVVVYT